MRPSVRAFVGREPSTPKLHIGDGDENIVEMIKIMGSYLSAAVEFEKVPSNCLPGKDKYFLPFYSQ